LPWVASNGQLPTTTETPAGQGLPLHSLRKAGGLAGRDSAIINGRLVSGAQPFENFKNIIEDELASSK